VKPIRVAVYLRVSSEEQRERHTIESQRERVLELISRERLVVVNEYRDDGVSGTIPLDDRPAGRQLLIDAREQRFDAEVVYRLDRLGRDTADGLITVRELERIGIGVRSATEEIDTTTPAGRFMLTMLFAAASYERDSIVQRSIDGSHRVARAGGWLGGSPPFGYRVIGQRHESRLVIDEDAIPGLTVSPADVVREIYRLAADEGWTCRRIGEHLMAQGIPCPGLREGWEHVVVHSVRSRRAKPPANVWRPSRIRNIITSSTYRGEHLYGKRSKQGREPVARAVPAIVDVTTWQRAQETLRQNLLFSPRNAKRRYLLRSMIRCGTCGMSYTGKGYPDHHGGVNIKYLCLGKHGLHGPYGARGERCPSMVIDGSVEELVWSDIEGFLRNPGAVLDEVYREHGDTRSTTRNAVAQQQRLNRVLVSCGSERDAVIGLYRRGRIDEATLDRQLDDIDRLERDARDELQRVQDEIISLETVENGSEGVEDILRKLRAVLDGELTWEVRRKLVELLVGGVRVDTAETDGVREAIVNVTYRFAPSTSRADTPTCTERSLRRR
jgi:site-specific DNA recombinase